MTAGQDGMDGGRSVRLRDRECGCSPGLGVWEGGGQEARGRSDDGDWPGESGQGRRDLLAGPWPAVDVEGAQSRTKQGLGAVRRGTSQSDACRRS